MSEVKNFNPLVDIKLREHCNESPSVIMKSEGKNLYSTIVLCDVCRFSLGRLRYWAECYDNNRVAEVMATWNRYCEWADEREAKTIRLVD